MGSTQTEAAPFTAWPKAGLLQVVQEIEGKGTLEGGYIALVILRAWGFTKIRTLWKLIRGRCGTPGPVHEDLGRRVCV